MNYKLIPQLYTVRELYFVMLNIHNAMWMYIHCDSYMIITLCRGQASMLRVFGEAVRPVKLPGHSNIRWKPWLWVVAASCRTVYVQILWRCYASGRVLYPRSQGCGIAVEKWWNSGRKSFPFSVFSIVLDFLQKKMTYYRIVNESSTVWNQLLS